MASAGNQGGAAGLANLSPAAGGNNAKRNNGMNAEQAAMPTSCANAFLEDENRRQYNDDRDCEIRDRRLPRGN